MAIQQRHSNREGYYFHNLLTGFIKKLENSYTTIDLRNESSVTGKIVLVDGFMNLELEDAVLYDNRGDEFPFETFFIRARNIRYVHIPLDVSIVNLVKEPLYQPRQRQSTKGTFKFVRSHLAHQQTLAELGAAQQNK